MGIKIDKEICNGCGKCSVSACMKVCPGNLISKNSDNKAEIKAACMALFLQNGKNRGTIVRYRDDMPHYYLLRPDNYITDIKKTSKN